MSRFVLDCAVSRPVSDRVARWYAHAALHGWADPTAGYHEGKQASMLLEQSAASLAETVGARHVEFCPDIRAAVAAAVSDLRSDAVCVATTAVDALQVIEACGETADSAGLPHHVLDVDVEGRVTETALEDLPTPAVLVTNLANQEIGTVQRDLTAWGQATGSRVVLDASTAFGWVDLPSEWSRVVLDARAWGGVPGAVALCSPTPARRSVAANVPAAAVAAAAAQQWLSVAPSARRSARHQIEALRERLESGIRGLEVRGGRPQDAPHILSVSVLYVDAEALQTRLDARGYAVGSGSACASRHGQPSHVLAAVGGFTGGNLRVGLSPDLPDEVVAGFGDALVEIVDEVRAEMGTSDL
jgi:cysteine desulfurase